MDIISLHVEIVGSQANRAVAICINGRNLVELVREVELPFAAREGHPKIAGKYVGLPASHLFLPSRHLLSDPAPLYESRGKTQVLGCKCGEAGCWPLFLRVNLGDKAVIWSDFEQPHRRSSSAASHWKYDQLGPFTFDRQQYEVAITGPETGDRSA
jgi:hypothetical protein